MKSLNFEEILLYEDEDYIVVNKPPFVSSLADRVSPINILSLAKEYCEEAQICHRLDKETSGCMLIARNNVAYRHAALLFQKRKVRKSYHAIVDGVHDFNETVDAPISIKSGSMARIDFGNGKKAQTEIKSIRIFRHHTLVECFPASGRLHQVRVHLSFKKAAITGDDKYGGRPIYLSQIKRKYHQSNKRIEQPLTRRFALHAKSISLLDLHSKELFVEAPYPEDFDIILGKLQKHS